MRLALVVNGFPVASETFLVSMAVGLRQAGVDLTVISQSMRQDGAMFAQQLGTQRPEWVQTSLLAGGLRGVWGRLARLIGQHPGIVWRTWHAAAKRYGLTRRAVKAWLLALPLVAGSFDLIHFAYSGIALAYEDSFPLLAPARLLTSCRGTAERITPVVKQERAAELARLFPQLDRIHCVSADMQRTIEGYGARPRQIFVNHPAIDATRFCRDTPYPIKENGPYTLLSVGRLEWLKGIEYALAAVRSLVDMGYEVRYEIIGTGAAEDSIRFAIHDLGLTNVVTLHGRQPGSFVHQKLLAADVYLLPSLSEGISNAALEAMAMAIPLVSSNAGGMAEALTDGVEGFLVPARDAAAITQAIRRLLDNPLLRQQMGKAGRRRVESHFHLQRQIDCFLQEYQAVLQSSGKEAYA